MFISWREQQRERERERERDLMKINELYHVIDKLFVDCDETSKGRDIEQYLSSLSGYGQNSTLGDCGGMLKI